MNGSNTGDDEYPPESYRGIELRSWERRRLKDRVEKLSTILQRILLQGLRVKMRLFEHADADPTDRDYDILRRTRQVLAVAAEDITVCSWCTSWLLRAHGFITPHTSSLLPELDDWM